LPLRHLNDHFWVSVSGEASIVPEFKNLNFARPPLGEGGLSLQDAA
jgi:hypothetical protein